MEKFFYLGQIFGAINTIGLFVAVAGLVTGAIFSICYICDSDKDIFPDLRKGIKWSFVIGVIACLIAALVPSKQTWYLMKGGEIIDTLNEGSRISKTAEKTLDLINNYLDEQLERMKE